MFESHQHPVISHRAFLIRMMHSIAIGIFIIAISLGLGMAGYHYIEQLPWIDAYENAVMILSCMGPVADMKTSYGKFFAGTYALFSGIVFLFTAGIVFTPLFHRLIHKFHVAEEKSK